MKKLTKIIAIVVSCLCMLNVLACSPAEIEVNQDKVQLYIGNYNGGVGSRWLEKAKADFEELYKDTKFTVNGQEKTGVEVVLDNDKVLYDGTQIKNSIAASPINLYFTERANYYSLVNSGLLYDITEAVTTKLDNGEKSISEKMNDSLNEYFCVDGKYYGVSHYRTYRGIVYDIDLYDENGLYIIDTNGGAFSIGGKLGDSNLSAGPNGKKGDFDDGLPATYDEFFSWCKEVKTKKQFIPICWDGTDKESYTGHLIDALATDAQGKKEMDYMYTLSSFDNVKADTVSIVGGEAVINKQDTISSRRDLLKMKGYYYSAKFLETLYEENYYSQDSMNTTQSNELTQYDFLHSRFDPDETPICMMVEGSWWEEEANGIFEGMEGSYPDSGRTERRLGFLPLPKIDKENLGNPTLFDGNQSIAFVNGNCDEVHADLAIKFLRFISTDEKLCEFHTITGIGRDYEYELGTAQYNSLSAYAKSIYDLSKSADIVYAQSRPYAQWQWTVNNPLTLSSSINGTTYTSVLSAVASPVISAEDYFIGLTK